jgi:hypothetical protein
VHQANHFYGHAHILSRYAKTRTQHTIPGYVQHGWNILDGFPVGQKVIEGSPLYVWSDSVVRRGWSRGRRHYHVIGAPWNYLLELEPDPPDVTREGTIFYPFHGWEGQEVTGDHRQMLRTLQEVETGPLTVCLYWSEHRNREVRKVYEDAGCRVITHGLRGYAYRGTDPKFLRRQLSELRRHERVVSNRLSSAILYGASVGCEVGVYGDPMTLEDEDPAFGGVERLHRLWPELHATAVPRNVAEAFAAEELGVRHLHSPAELRDLFRWNVPRERPAQ